MHTLIVSVIFPVLDILRTRTISKISLLVIQPIMIYVINE